ncbi:rhomboid family intramembrane serine protease [Fulvivirga sp. M361]|uniref:rhomboid family intramembrane serine protease n=1 Tax=Fulvivirga sp. M361 TaxID=2594266 RepID=UPI00117B6DB0|nr:rhomboid family intramembrane serine protease [Fulvivirga sp. M361]TRX49827.1 rhomboid family intramembrane serine protease [Fulvivirga sp. M361]
MYGGGIKEDFKNAFKRPNSAHTQLIIINVVVFLFLAITWVFSSWFGFPEAFSFIYDQFTIPPSFAEFVTRPWTLFTYAFAHSLEGIFHILFNMLIFYWFAKLVIEYLGSDKVISLYVLGALAGGIAYLLVYNLVPFYVERSDFSGMVGASAAVYAVVVAAATLMPNYTFFLLFLGPVKIKYIAAFYIVLSFLGSVGANAGGNVAHLGGALMGFIYIKQLQGGTDWGRWVISVMDFVKSFFVKRSNIKVSYKRQSAHTGKTQKKTASKSAGGNSASDASQDEIDAILDKISERGYESLTKEEKQKLFNASKK